MKKKSSLPLKPSISCPSILELKTFPSQLQCSLLSSNDSLLLIISVELKISMSKLYYPTWGYICLDRLFPITDKIQFREDYITLIKIQWNLNPPTKKVVKKIWLCCVTPSKFWEFYILPSRVSNVNFWLILCLGMWMGCLKRVSKLLNEVHSDFAPRRQ